MSGFEPIDEPADVPPPPPLGAPGPPISSTDAIARYILPVDQEDVSGTDLYA